MVDAGAAVQLVAGSAAAVSAAGGAVVGVRALIQSFKHFRALGLSHKDSFAMARVQEADKKDAEYAAMWADSPQFEKNETFAVADGEFAKSRQAEKDEEEQAMRFDRDMRALSVAGGSMTDNQRSDLEMWKADQEWRAKSGW